MPSTTGQPDLEMDNIYELYTNDSNDFTRIVMMTELQHFQFLVGACSEAYIILHTNPGNVGDDDAAYHIVLGTEYNQKSEIRKKGSNGAAQSFDTPDILRCLANGYSGFHLSWGDGDIALRETDAQGHLLFNWHDDEYDINSIALGSRHEETSKWLFMKSQGR
jgi:hypothetical protein